jgi:hypothetical protein
MAAPKARSCHRHHDAGEAVACAQCGFPLCDACWTHVHAGAPWCATCATEATTRSFRRWSWAVTFFALSAGATVLAWRSSALADSHVAVVIGAVVGLGVAVYLVYRAASGDGGPEVSLRGTEAAPPSERAAAAHPYRARLRHMGMRVVPRVSGKVATLLGLLSMGLCAVLFPTLLRLPRWVEAEAVLGAWWATLAVSLAVLLYRGIHVADDFRFRLKPLGGSSGKGGGSSGFPDFGGCADVGGADAEGCLVGLVVIVALAALLGASFLVAEIVLPVLFMGCYWLLNRAIGRVANDRHGCEGKIGRATLWGALWATLYVAPLALAVWGLHRAWPR